MSLARRAIGSRALGQGPEIAGAPPASFLVAWGATDDDDLWGTMRKNVAGQFISAQLVSAADGSDFTSTVTVTVTIDNGTQTAGGGTVTHKGGGEHSYAPTQAETNGDRVAFKFSGTGAVSRTINVFPSFPQTGDGFARIGAPVGASISADIAAVQADTDNLQTRIPAALVSGRIDASVGAMAAGVVTAAAVATDAIDADALAANAVTEIWAGSTAPTAAATADAVWDEARSGHTTSGTFGESYAAIESGSCITGTLTTTAATTDLTEATNDHYIGRTIVWITGALTRQASAITDYDGATKTLTYALVTDAPANGDRFVLV